VRSGICWPDHNREALLKSHPLLEFIIRSFVRHAQMWFLSYQEASKEEELLMGILIIAPLPHWCWLHVIGCFILVSAILFCTFAITSSSPSQFALLLSHPASYITHSNFVSYSSYNPHFTPHNPLPIAWSFFMHVLIMHGQAQTISVALLQSLICAICRLRLCSELSVW
jgi:hypothetical protein